VKKCQIRGEKRLKKRKKGEEKDVPTFGTLFKHDGWHGREREGMR